MLFNSYAFIFIFLPTALIAFYALTALGLVRLGVVAVGGASLVFYGIGQPQSLPLLLISVVVNYIFGNAILACMSARSRRGLLIGGLGVDLGALAYFKYAGFVAANLKVLVGWPTTVPTIVLPVGISFFTFTQIAYLIDCYREKAHAYTFADYLYFVTFFPHLVAGPILNHKAIIPQIGAPKFGRLRSDNVLAGLIFLSFGLFKKVIVADSIAPQVDLLFAHAGSLSILETWAAALFYTFQLYFDFSGYSDMAVGLGRLFGIHLPFNFDSPYKSGSIIEFWRRWHMSLSSFLRDYLYIPLGGNRYGEHRRYVNLLITMALGGIWHGAGWTYLIWGTLHGLMLCANHLWRRLGIALPRSVAWPVTMMGVVVAWVVFRAKNLTDGWLMIGTLFGVVTPESVPATPYVSNPMTVAITIAAMALWCTAIPNSQEMVDKWGNRPGTGFVAAAMALVAIMFFGRPSVFLYYQF